MLATVRVVESWSGADVLGAVVLAVVVLALASRAIVRVTRRR
jgi:hypothetical protein